VFEAALKRSGTVRVATYTQLFAAARIISMGKIARGDRLGIVTNGRGPALMAVDAAAANDVPLAVFTPKTIERLETMLPADAPRGNPVDLRGDAPPQRMTREDCAAVHRDIVSLSCLSLRDRIVGLDSSGLSERARNMRHRVSAWDGSMARDSVEAGDVAEIRTQLVRLIANHGRFARLRASGFRDEPPVVWPLEFRIALALGTLLQHDPESVFGTAATWEALLLQALEGAAADTAAGARWGDRHRPFFAHPLRGWSGDLDTLLAAPAAALGGDLDCVFATGSPIGIFDMVIVGSTARYVFDLADRDAGGWIVPLGASGHPASPHFADQHQRWSDGELLPIVSDWSRLEDKATARLQLSAA